MEYLGLLLLVWACAIWLQRALWRREERRGKRKPRFRPDTAALGNALHNLQAIVNPKVKYLVEEKLEEHMEEDDEAGPKDPTAHLLRQARRIRRGEKVGQLTTLLPP